MSTKIEWTDEVWNPVTGCTKVSQGCKNCYAERIAERFWGERKFSDVQCHEDRLDIPLHWRKSRRVFVNSMSDLFHRKIDIDFTFKIFNTMAITPYHTYMILTKRPYTMMEVVRGIYKGGYNLPLQNVWLGVSVEDQATADERIPWLLKTPAAVRFVSYEPALGPVDFSEWIEWSAPIVGWQSESGPDDSPIYDTNNQLPGLDWIIAGGETGPHARPAHPDWFRSVRDQCQEAGVPFFFKQWGEFVDTSNLNGAEAAKHVWYGNRSFVEPKTRMMNPGKDQVFRVGRKYAGRLLDGREWNEYPEVANAH